MRTDLAKRSHCPSPPCLYSKHRQKTSLSSRNLNSSTKDVALQSQRGNELLEHAIEGSTYLYRWNAKAPHDAVNTNTLNSYYNCEDSTSRASLTYKVCKSTGGVPQECQQCGFFLSEVNLMSLNKYATSCC